MGVKKVSYGLMALLVVLGVSIVFAVRNADGLLKKASNTLVDLKASDQAAAQQTVQLAQNKKDIKTYKPLDDIAKTVVPQDKDQAEAVREIVNLASKAGIAQLSSISFPPSTLGATKTKPPGGLTQVTKVKGISGVYDLQITVTQDSTTPVPYTNFVDFLSKLETNRRTAQVSSITIQPDSKNPSTVSFTLVIDEFIKP